ncbi:MAG: divalent metal cation transporter [Planctomycetota bacterium]
MADSVEESREAGAAGPVARDRQMLADAAGQGLPAQLRAFLKLSGPGWVQSAVTLGGGSLGSALYLGVLGGYSLMWLQPLAMIMGVIMLSVIGYVTLSTGERPFVAINQHVNPLLGWSWAIAVALANVIWCMPQHSLSYSVLSQNLLPSSLFGEGGSLATWATGAMGDSAFASQFDKYLIAAVILMLCTAITWSYDRGSWGLKLYETVLKIVVALIVLCFFGVVVRLSFSSAGLDWGAVFAGLVPDFGQMFRPADSFVPFLDAVGPAGDPARDFWSGYIVAQQNDIIIAAAATAVGINMTFLYPYTLLRKGWTKEFRGLAIFDLSTSMFVPFILATGCVVIASAAQFHTKPPTGFSMEEGAAALATDEAEPGYKAFEKLIKDKRNPALPGAGDPSEAELTLAAVLVKRDALDLAAALEPLTGRVVGNYVFGFGVLAMVLSTISVLMLMSGTVIAEMLNYPPGGWAHRFGTLVTGVGGVLWPIFWADASSNFYLSVVASVFGFMLLPFAYVTFSWLLNSKALLGDEMPRGGKRLLINTLVFASALLTTVGAVYKIWDKAKVGGLVVLGCFVLLVIVVAINQRNTRLQQEAG